MKTTKPYFSVELIIKFSYTVLPFDSVDEISEVNSYDIDVDFLWLLRPQ